MPISTPTLSIADNANGTGAVATIAGGDASATNTLYRSQLTSGFGTLAPVNSGSRVGNGTISVSVGPAYFVWHVLSVLAAESVVSNLVYQAVTDGVQAVHWRCLTAIKAKLQSLGLTDISSANFDIRRLPRPQERKDQGGALVPHDPLPLVTLSPPCPRCL